MERHTIKRLRKGKTSMRKSVFFREICEATREPQWKNRIIAEFSLPAKTMGSPNTESGIFRVGLGGERRRSANEVNSKGQAFCQSLR